MFIVKVFRVINTCYLKGEKDRKQNVYYAFMLIELINLKNAVHCSDSSKYANFCLKHKLKHLLSM